MNRKNLLITIVTASITAAVTSIGLGHLKAEGNASTVGDSVQVLSVANLKLEQARALLKARGLSLAISEKRKDRTIKAGRIVQQEPLEGSWVEKGTKVRVVLSAGPDRPRVPALPGLSLNEAMVKITNARLRVGAISREFSDEVPLDHIIRSVPAAGTDVTRAKPVNMVVSDGKQKVEVPRVTGARLGYATAKLEKAGFSVVKVRHGYDEDRSDGRVLSQSPRAGSAAAPGTGVTLVVNNTE
jgi:serine/threonine-protein kinase